MQDAGISRIHDPAILLTTSGFQEDTMPFSNRDFISNEKHELDHVLEKWNKRATQANRDILTQVLDAFNGDTEQKPHIRDPLYTYGGGSM